VDYTITYYSEAVQDEILDLPDTLGRLCIAYAVATEVFRADDAKVRAAVYFTYTRHGPTKSAARKAPSLRVAPETGAGGVTRLVDIRDIDCASRLAIARFRLQRDPRRRCRVSLARYVVLTRRMVAIGPNLGAPHTKAFGEGLFELRLKAADGIARVFFCTLVGKRIVMLHSFVKKTERTPPHDRELAETRMKEIKRANA